MKRRPDEASRPLLGRTGDAREAVTRHVRRRIQGALHQRLSLALQAFLLLGTVVTAWQGQWLTAFTTGSILIVTLLPLILGRRFEVL